MSGALVDGIARRLSAAGVGEYDPDNPLTGSAPPIELGTMSPDGDQAVTVTTYPGGPPPDSVNGWEYPRLQVRVRGATALDALDLDRAAFNALQASPGVYPVTLEPGGWLLQDCYALQSEGQPLGQDANGRHEYARNYQLAVEPA